VPLAVVLPLALAAAVSRGFAARTLEEPIAALLDGATASSAADARRFSIVGHLTTGSSISTNQGIPGTTFVWLLAFNAVTCSSGCKMTASDNLPPTHGREGRIRRYHEWQMRVPACIASMGHGQ
jgi:hypothetical protein